MISKHENNFYSPFASIIQNWYPKSSPTILKYLDKLALPKPETSTPEAYLTSPEDSLEDQSEFPIEVSDDGDEMQSSNESSEEDDSLSSQVDRNALDSDEDEEL